MANNKKKNNKTLVQDEKKNKKNKQIISDIDRASLRNDINKFTREVSPMASILRNALNDEDRKLPDSEIHESKVDVSNSQLSIKGTHKGKVKITDIISESLGNRYSELTRFNGYGFGTSSFLRQARINKFIEYNLPVMSTSCGLMTDDILNGSNFGNEEQYEKPFSFYKSNGSTEITDSDTVNKMMSLLIPEDRDTISTEVKSALVLARDGIYNARKDGCCVIRVIPYSTIAKNMYIKWVLKESKIKYSMESQRENLSKENGLFVKDKKSLDQINSFLNSIGLENLTIKSNIRKYLDESIISSIPKELIIEKEINKIDTNKNMDKLYSKEINNSETFQSFVSRFLSGDINKIYAYESQYKFKEYDENDKKEPIKYSSKKTNTYFSFSVGGFNHIDYESIINQLTEHGDSNFSLESLENNTDNIISDLDLFDKETIKNTSFDEIYNLRVDDIIKKGSTSSSFYSTESMGNTFSSEKTKTMKPIEKLLLKVVDKIDSSGLSSNYSLEAGESGLSGPLNSNDVTNGPMGSKNVDKVIEKAEAKYSEYKKLDRMFSYIKGEHIELIDNTNVHYVMANDRLMGVFQMELSNEELQNLIAARNMIYSGAMGAGMSYDNVNVDDIDIDQTVGRLMFTDYVKPILEKYMSKDFIKNNVNLGFSLMKIMDENDMSNMANGATELGSSIYNYTKVNFIPAEELIFFRNGNKGLGDSLFKRAEIPAHMCILLREEYLGWIISDGKGVTFVTVPQGSSEINGEFGMSSIFDQIDEFMNLDRTSLRNTLSTNIGLTRKYFKVVKPDGSPDIKIDNIDMPDFPINTDIQLQLTQEATEQVGYNVSLFSSTDGNIELARKLYEMNGTKVLEILTSQQLFKRTISQLATLLLHLRGGEEYKDINVLWNPPIPSKINIDQRINTITSKMDLMNKMIEVLDSIYEKSSALENYEDIRTNLLLSYVKDIFNNDKIFDDIDQKVKKAEADLKVKLATTVSEK